MFYKANFIKLSVVLDLLWKYSLLLCYKLNIFRRPWVNQFNVCALLFRGYIMFIPLDKMVFYGYWKDLNSGSSSMLHIALNLCPLYYGLYFSLSNYYLNNYNSVLWFMRFYYCLSGWNYIISLTFNYWRNFDRAIMWRQFVGFKEFVNRRTRVTSSSDNNLPQVISCLMWDYIIYVSQY